MSKGNEIASFARDGDIFFWSWKDPERSLHCCSGKAVARNGFVNDTYWCGVSENKMLSTNDCDFRYKGNVEDFIEITEDEIPYYDPKHVVDMRHANNSRGPIYLSKGAKRCPVAMERHVTDLIEAAKRERDFAERRIEMQDKNLSLILSGRLDEVYF